MSVWEHLGDPEAMGRLLLHPSHGGVASALGRLLAEQREVPTRDAARSVQEHLAAVIAEAERRFGEARRLQKKGTGDALDVTFWRQACTQFRAVGDAVAWKFLGYRRQWLLLMGRNPHPGLMTGKAGFDDEWQLFNQHWDLGEPTLLTALTNCVTIGDLLVARGDELWTIEVKRDARRFGGAQKDRMALLTKQLSGEPRIDEGNTPSWVLESDVPLQTFWTSADSHIERAMCQGSASWVPSPGVAVLFTAVGPALSLGRDEAARVLQAEREAAATSLGPATHSIVVHSYHFPYRSKRTAPFGVFPIRPEYAAMLLAGELHYTVELRIERLLAELESVGLTVKHLLPEEGSGGPLPSDVIHWRGTRGRGVVHAAAIEQIAVELMDPAVWAEALASSSPPPGPERRWGLYVCLSGEDRVWR